tara:strand:+ start:712 stop:2076 length:1365 start_codon:yes stop_codon:yes gene_type:complete
MKKRKKNIFEIILFSNIVIFTTILYLSIPALFNYENLENVIENKFYREFDVVLKIQDKISYKVLPKPHLLIKKATLDLNANDTKSSIIETKNLKIYVPIGNIYSISNIEIKKIEITETNFNFTFKDVEDFRDHMFNKINKPILIKNSKFFYLDDKKNVILISPIDSAKYSINLENKFKQLKLKGNIFDTKYHSVWKKNYDDPNKTSNEIKFKNPNLKITNNFVLNENSIFSGKSLINFLNENIIINYEFDKDTVSINSPANIVNQKIKIFSNINLDPFYLDAKIIMIEKNYKFLINYLLYYLINIDKNFLENLNGKLTLYFKGLDNEVIDSGKIDLIIEKKSIKVIKSNFKINNIGIINSDFKYYEKEGELIFSSRNELKIEDPIQFARKFQLDFDKAKKIKKIFFDLEKNIKKDEFLISNIYINKINKNKKNEELYSIKNLQTLKSLLRGLII